MSSLLIALLLAEGAAQLFYRRHQGSWLWQAGAFKVHFTQPVADRRQYALRPSYHDHELNIDSLGFRRPSPPPGHGGGKVVVCLGDSVPFGAGVGDEQTYPAQLGEMLKVATQGRFSVLNAGVPSYNLRQAYDRLRWDVLPNYPDICLITIQATNDISLLTQFRERYTPDLTWAEIRWQRNWVNAWARYSAVLWYWQTFVDSRQAKPKEKEHHQAFDGKAMLTNVRTVLDELAALCQERSIPLLLLPSDPFYYQTMRQEQNPTLPQWARLQVMYPLWVDLIDKFNQELEATSHRHRGVYFLDTRRAFDLAGRQLPFYIDFIHYSPEGNQVVARELLDWMQRREIIPPTSSHLPN